MANLDLPFAQRDGFNHKSGRWRMLPSSFARLRRTERDSVANITMFPVANLGEGYTSSSSKLGVEKSGSGRKETSSLHLHLNTTPTTLSQSPLEIGT